MQRLMAVAVALASLPVFAGLHTWCYTGTDPAQARWNVADNWEGGVPEAGEADCEIVIPSSAAATVDNDIEGLELKSLTISGSAAFTLTGQKVKLVPNTGKFASTCDGFTLAMPIELGEGGTNEFAVGAATAGTKENPVAALSNTFNAGVLTGKGAVLGLGGSSNLRREASLTISDPEAKVDLASGVEQRIAHLYLPVLSDPDPATGAVTTNLVEAAAGTWGSPDSAAENKSAFFTGTGLVKTGKVGLLLLVR